MKSYDKLLKKQVERYRQDYGIYEKYAEFLKEILGKASKRIAPFSIVEAREKSRASHAAKVMIKKEKFHNPAYHITDLCGARVITQTSQEKELICDYIRRNFDIDKDNSIDVRSRLKEDEFGYLSVHYIVQIKESDQQLEGVPVPAELKRGPAGHKAEIQVRTLLEHAWANILHDRMYKTKIQAPKALKREAAALAATMEEADRGFSGLAQRVDAYLGCYSASLSREKIEEEMAILKALKSAPKVEGDEPEKANVALRLGRLACAQGKFKEAVKELREYADKPTPSQDAIRVELGRALCRWRHEQPSHKQYRDGQLLLEGVVGKTSDPRNPVLPAEEVLRAEAAHILAWSYSRQRDGDPAARRYYSQAYDIDPSNPYHLVSFIEYEVFLSRYSSFINVMRGAIREAIATCRAHLAVCIEVPRAYFTIGRLHLLAGEYGQAFNAYTRAIGAVLAPDTAVPASVLDEEIDFLLHINPGKDIEALPFRHGMVRKLLLLTRALRSDEPRKVIAAHAMQSAGAAFIAGQGRNSILIVSGGASLMAKETIDRHKKVVERSLVECDGLVCSGATTTGIPGLVGRIARGLRNKESKKFALMGYIPHRLPHDAQKDRAGYDEIIATAGEEFSELEPLQNWIDLIHAGVMPHQVRVLGIEGGEIAAFEYRLALALGAKVGVVKSSGRAADEIQNDPYWHDHPNLVRLPLKILDAATARAFVRPANMQIDAAKLEELAEKIHNKYLATSPYSDIDPSRKTYGKLRKDLQESNRQQARYISEILATEGYAVVPARQLGKQQAVRKFSAQEIEHMAELEHGRWNIERLSAGWQYGATKDADKKINPSLVPWNKLPDEVKMWDRNAVEDFPNVLEKAGLRIVKRKVPR